MGWKKWLFIVLIIFLGIIFIFSIGDEEEIIIDNLNNSEIVPKGDRLLGFDYTPTEDITEEEAFEIAREAGMNSAQIYLQWNEVDSGNSNFSGKGIEIIDSRKNLFVENNISAFLSVNAVSELGDQRPDDLKGKPWNDSEVIERYKITLDQTFNELYGVNIVVLSLGNEIDSKIKSEEDYAEYIDFSNKIIEYVHEKYPGVKVGVKSTLYGLTAGSKDELINLNKNTDAVLATYYPLNFLIFGMKSPDVVYEDIDKLINIYPEREIYFIEIGYPSSEVAKGSLEKQERFIRNIFLVWDKYPNIKAMNFLWLHDLPPETVDFFEEAYGISDKGFLAYLETLGLRTYDGKDKPAFIALKEEAKKRGF